MSEIKGFLNIKRKDAEYRPVGERIKDFKEVEIRMTDDEIKQQAARCMDCGVPFCHGCGCPLDNLIPEWNDLVYRGHWKKAIDLLYLKNNFPEFTGRICPALCEASCTAGLSASPVAIREIEVNIIEKGYAEGYIRPKPPKKRTGRKIAVVGAGPAGLTAADDLNRLGYEVCVFEQDKNAGGILRYGIPDFKLEKKIIDRRTKLMEDEGVRFENGVKIGADISLKYLRSRFDAVCIACGARKPRDLNIQGRELDGVYFAMDFLVKQNKKVSDETPDGGDITVKGKHVLVIGGGDTGSDCVGTSIRQGASSVTQIEIMPKPPEQISESTPWPMWPYLLRTSSSHQEGCERLWNIMTKSFEGEKGKLKQVRAVKVEWESDPLGRPTKMKEIPNSEFIIKADAAFISMGFTGVINDAIISESQIKLTDKDCIAVDSNMMTSAKGVFAAGDAVSGASLVVRAIASGKNMAEAVHKFISDKNNPRRNQSRERK